MAAHRLAAGDNFSKRHQEEVYLIPEALKDKGIDALQAAPGTKEGRGRKDARPRTRKLFRLDALDGNLIAVQLPGERHLLSGNVLDLVLIGDVEDLPVFRHKHGFIATTHASLGASLVAPHRFLTGTGLVYDVAGPIRGRSRDRGQRERKSELFQWTPPRVKHRYHIDYTPNG